MRRLGLLCLLLPLFAACEREPEYDLLVRGGTVYDGSGSAGVAGEVAIRPGVDAAHPDHVHKAVLAGLLSHLGVRDATARWALAHGHLMRDRFTIADLAFFMGLWEATDVDALLVSAARLGAGL